MITQISRISFTRAN